MSAVSDLEAQLRAQGVIPADAPAASEQTTDRPWFVALLQGVAGWLAGIFLLVFAGMTLKLESGVALFLLGAPLLAAAWFMYHADRHAVFLDQFALAMSIAGQIALTASVNMHHGTGLSIAATALIVQLIVLSVMPNKAARTLAALFAAIAWIYTARFLLLPASADDLVFGEGGHALAYRGWMIPVHWLLTWIPLLALAHWLIRQESRWTASKLRVFARPMLTGLLLALPLGGLEATAINPLGFAVQPVAMPLTWWALFPLLNVALCMYAAYAAFLIRSNWLSGSAVLGAMLHLSTFYYLYGTTLMWKSLIMASAGVALLIAGVALEHRKPGSGGTT